MWLLLGFCYPTSGNRPANFDRCYSGYAYLLLREASVRTEKGRFMVERLDLSGSEAVFNESAT